MIWLYNTILYNPIYNLLVFLYDTIPGNDIGVAIILLTIIIKVVLLPLSWQSIKAQKSLQDLQPKIDELKTKLKDQKEKLAQEMMKLYSANKVNPFSSCLPLLLQFPFLIAVYQVFRSGLTNNQFDLLYPFVANPGTINSVSFGIMDLAVPSIVLAVLAGAGQYVQTKMLMTKKAPKTVAAGAKDENLMAEMNKSMTYFMPLVTIVIGTQLPAGLTLYWIITTVLTILQQKFLIKRNQPANAGIIDVDAKEKNDHKLPTT
ncbi:TPA: hypothetical protein DF272_06870 [Candidatus Falkowbacteria bacterium]|nr:hypothetical protein [Candidatus Falkowbacteria bacterium]